MKFFPKYCSLPSHKHLTVLSLSLLCLLTGLSFNSDQQLIVSAQEKAGAQLRAAVASNSEAELQRIESASPGTDEAGLAQLLRGYLRLQAKDNANAAAILGDPNIGKLTALGDYALYYRGQALQDAGRGEDAEREFRRMARAYPTSLLARTAALQAAGSALLRNDYKAVIEDVEPLVEKNDGTALKLRADALEKLGRLDEAKITLRKLFFDAPQSAEAEKVGARLAALGSSTDAADASQLKRRADKLYQAGLFVIAGQVYDQMARQFPGAATDEVWLKAGMSYYKGNSFRPAAEALARVHSRNPKTTADALYYLGMANLSLNNESAALQALADLRREGPSSARVPELLYGFGRYHEKRDRDTQAGAFYSQLARQFPQTEHADEAHFWLAWRAHQAKDYANSSRLLTEHIANYGAVTDNRGKAGFWAAVDSERSGDKPRAMTIYRALLMRYGPGWYGMNAERRLARLAKEGVEARSIQTDLALRRAVEGLHHIDVPEETIGEADRERVEKAQQLMRLSLHQAAMNELDVARVKAPNSPIINLRIAQIFRANGENVAAINALKRAYPDYGQSLPDEMPREAWEVFYPLKWWSNIKEEARRHGLDPYLVAGIIRQESVFNPQAHSRSNAYGLMQLLPSTGQAVARKTGGGGVSTSDLYNPVLNIQLGTAYVREMLDRFGRFEYVAAAYNGGPTRVSRWLNELPPAEIEEWIESIPLSETRSYVQGVYRNARQYQRLYDEQGRFRASVPER